MAWCSVLMAWCSVLMAWCSVLMAWCSVLMAWCSVLMARCSVLMAWYSVLMAQGDCAKDQKPSPHLKLKLVCWSICACSRTVLICGLRGDPSRVAA